MARCLGLKYWYEQVTCTLYHIHPNRWASLVYGGLVQIFGNTRKVDIALLSIDIVPMTTPDSLVQTFLLLHLVKMHFSPFFNHLVP